MKWKMATPIKEAIAANKIYDPKLFFCPSAENACEAHLNTAIFDLLLIKSLKLSGIILSTISPLYSPVDSPGVP